MKMLQVRVAAALILYGQLLYSTGEVTGGSGDEAAATNKANHPCENFYRYACRGKGSKEMTTPGYLKKEMLKKIEGILADLPSSDSSTLDMNKKDIKSQAKKLYTLCLQDSDKSSRLRTKSNLLTILNGLGIEKWPVVVNHTGTTYENVLSRTGLRPFATLKTVPDEISGTFLLKMNLLHDLFSPYPHVMKLTHERRRSELYQSYKMFIKAVVQIFEFSRKTSAPEGSFRAVSTQSEDTEELLLSQIIGDIIEIETALAKMSLTPGPRSNHTTLSVMQWQEKFGGTFPFTSALKADFLRAGIVLRDSTMVGMHNEDYFMELVTYLPGVELRKLINYIGWYFVRDMADMLTINIRKKLNLFLEKASRPGVPVNFTETVCIEKLIGYKGIMETGIAHLYAKRYFGETFIAKASAIVSSLNNSFSNLILKNKWMDRTTRCVMLNWLTDLQYRMGAYSELLDEKYVIKKYHRITLPLKESLVVYFSLYKENNYQENLKLSDQKYDREEFWPGSILETKGRYSELYTIMEMPAAALQEAITTSREHKPRLYGALATLTAETLADGFFQEGRIWLRRPSKSEWTEETKEEFRSALSCLRIRRGAHPTPQKDQARFDRDNSELTIRSKLDDHISLRTSYGAFMAARTDTSTQPEEAKEVAQAKKFFEAYAQRYCGSGATKDEERRVNFALKTYAEFWLAFDCKKETKMRSEDQCDIVPKWEDTTQLLSLSECNVS